MRICSLIVFAVGYLAAMMYSLTFCLNSLSEQDNGAVIEGILGLSACVFFTYFGFKIGRRLLNA